MVGATRVARRNGAREIYACATHGVLCGPAIEDLRDSALKQLVVTDSIPVDARKRPENMTVLSVSGLLAEAIMNVFADDSVSAIFGGENQLF